MKKNNFYRKSELQMFLLISGAHIGAPKWYTNWYGISIQSSTRFGKELRNCGPRRPDLLRDSENDL